MPRFFKALFVEEIASSISDFHSSKISSSSVPGYPKESKTLEIKPRLLVFFNPDKYSLFLSSLLISFLLLPSKANKAISGVSPSSSALARASATSSS